MVGGETSLLRKVWCVCTVPCLLLREVETMWHCVGMILRSKSAGEETVADDLRVHEWTLGIDTIDSK